METEVKIVYNIIETVRAGKSNSDEPLSERLIRSYLQEFRGDIIRKHYKDGHTISEQVFQDTEIIAKGNRLINPETNNNSELIIDPLEKEELRKRYTFNIPKIIRLNHNYGMYVIIDEFKIPVIESYQYDIRSKDFFNKNQIMAVLNGKENLDLYIPNTNIKKTNIIRNYLYSILNENKFKDLKIKLRAILSNPDDAIDYDWTKDQYPFPDERMTELIYSILARKFQIILNAKSDEVINARGDEILYHENHNLSNQ